jgi:hypothetical protein
MKAGRAKCGIIGDCQKVLLCAALSESSVIRLDKAGKTAGLQWQKRWILLPGIGSPGKVGNNGIQEIFGSIQIASTKFLMVYE